MDQLSGAEPYYDELRYNKNKGIRKAHNCYDYAFNHLDPEQKNKSQPGLRYLENVMPTNDYNCPMMHDRLKLDHPEMYRVSKTQDCKPDYYKIALVIDPDKDYHFFRQDPDGYWSHKPGADPVTRKDFSGNLIHDPHPNQIDLNNEISGLNYEMFCDYYCVNEDDGPQGHFYEASRGSRLRNGEAVPGWEFYEVEKNMLEVANSILD